MSIWLVVIAVGAYHGLSPGMGWPLAVSNGLFKRSGRSVFSALLPLAAGHFLAMTAALLPFALMLIYLDWSRAIRIGAGLAVVGFGIWRLLDSRHPRFLSRVRPTQLTLWSFLIATAHGAGLMLVPMYLRLCTPASAAAGGTLGDLHAATETFMRSSLGTAVAVAAVHTVAMLVTGGAVAWAVYRWFGLKAIGTTWFNLDRAWAVSLILSGAVGVATAFAK